MLVDTPVRGRIDVQFTLLALGVDMYSSLDLVRLANAWRSKARSSQSQEEALTLEKCADQIMQVIHADAIEVQSRPVKPAQIRAS